MSKTITAEERAEIREDYATIEHEDSARTAYLADLAYRLLNALEGAEDHIEFVESCTDATAFHCQQWEDRALSAEAERDELRQVVARVEALVAEHNHAFRHRKRAFDDCWRCRLRAALGSWRAS